VDAEQKSSRIESLIAEIYFSLVDVEDELKIETNYFLVKHFKVKLAGMPSNLSFNDGSSVLLPSTCNLIEKCQDSEFILIKVKILLFSFISIKT
jgi:hypothetical protein